MVSLKEKYMTVVTESEWVYEYATKEEYKEHLQEMKEKGITIYFWKQLKNGKYQCRYIKREEQTEQMLP